MKDAKTNPNTHTKYTYTTHAQTDCDTALVRLQLHRVMIVTENYDNRQQRGERNFIQNGQRMN